MSKILRVMEEVEKINAVLEKYGLEVDSQKYIEQRLNIPIKKVKVISNGGRLGKSAHEY